MTYVAQLRSRQSVEKATLARIHAQQDKDETTMIQSWAARAARDKKGLVAQHNAQFPLTKKANKLKNAAEKTQLASQHKREKATWASHKKSLGYNQKLEKSNMVARHKNDMTYAVKMAKKK